MSVRSLVESRLFSNKKYDKKESLYGSLSAISQLTLADVYFDLRDDNKFRLGEDWYKIDSSDAPVQEFIEEMRNICSRHLDNMDSELLKYMEANNIYKE